jgi:hypothetical protein
MKYPSIASSCAIAAEPPCQTWNLIRQPYPVPSLSLEVTMKIFGHCILVGSTPRPFPTTAPLLVAQNWSQWRQIAISTPECLDLGDE